MGDSDLSNWEKLKLLVWKNWILQWNKKIHFILALVIPIVFLSLVVLMRILVKPESMPEIRFNHVEIDNLFLYFKYLTSAQLLRANGTVNLPFHIMAFSPKNHIYQSIMTLASYFLSPIGLRSYRNAKELEDELIHKNIFVGVQFDDDTKDIQEFPKKFAFSLRFPSELRTAYGNDMETWQTSSLFPSYEMTGPRNKNSSDGGIPVGYIREGFLPVQHAIVTAYLTLATAKPQIYVSLKRFPYPEHIYDPLLSGLQGFLPLMLLLSYAYPCTFMAKYVTHEKEKQLKEIMKIMGLHNWIHWTAWFVKSFLMLLIITCVVVFLLKFNFIEGVAILTFCSWSVLFCFLIVYSIATICFCFMMAVLFDKASTASAVTGVIFFLSYFPYNFAKLYYERFSLTSKMCLCLISNSALGLGLRVITAFEGTGEGLQWRNLREPISVDDDLTLLHVILMLLLAAVIYMLICLYIDEIRPGQYGVPKKWYFPFHIKCKATKNARISSGVDTTDNVGLRLVNLHKKYGKSLAVKGLTLDMYVNEITVLLGHNGAGKTTTILMLTGILPPTEGTAFINGYDIRTDLTKARHSLGICPQHNVLFEQMSVKNHIVFFSCLKGVRGKSAIQQEIQKYIRIMELENKSNVLASKLSGGMKRKLSLCCALCGNTKTVLCDEPSSGVDPAARRRLWDLLQAEKIGRTILLTTHHMDEADVLGDRIAIMCDGKLQCYGTPFTLKKLYGSGYRLICVKRQGCIESEVTALLRKYIPNIGPESEIGTELSYRLSTENTKIYANMLADLEDKSDELKINGFGLSIASLEEVFMRVGAEQSVNKNESENLKRQERERDAEYKQLAGHIFNTETREPNQRRRSYQKCRAMFLKKIFITKANWQAYLLQLTLPIIFMLITCFNASGSTNNTFLKPLPIDFKKYPKAVGLLEVATDVSPNSIEATIAREYENFIESEGRTFESTNDQSFEDYILEAIKVHPAYVSKTYLAGATILSQGIIVWLNNKPLHTAPLTLNVLHNAIARALIGPDAEIRVTNAPLPFNATSLSNRLHKGSRLGIEISINLSLSMCIVSALYALSLIRENERRSILLQFVSGVNIYAYWFSHQIWDFITYTLIAVCAILTITVFQEIGFKNWEDLRRYLFLLLLFGFTVLPLTYVFALFFKNSATGFTVISVFNFFTGIGLFVIVFWLSIEAFGLRHIAETLKWYFRIFPHFCLTTGLYHLHINYNMRRSCQLFSAMKPGYDICEVLTKCCNIPEYFDWREPGVLPEIVYLIGMAMVLMVCLLLSHTKIKYWLRSVCETLNCKAKRHKGGEGSLDDDINAEARRIENFTKEERVEFPLILDRVSKRYGRHVAVNGISLCVSRGECFGLLGVNGAGKTSTFKMLTGDVGISSGNAYVTGISLRTQMHKVYSKFGYCPQFDALFDELTGRETMRIYCLLRGVRARYIRTLSEQLAQSFGFVKHIDKRTKHYSGGNKRKLSAAISLIGNPIVMYLDEPTSGMDPAARRQLWNMVCNIRDVGKSIVLTSHSMEECEALCTRLAIMVNGEFKCMGSTQHLKNKYSKGLVLKIKASKDLNAASQEVIEVLIKLLNNVNSYMIEAEKEESNLLVHPMEELKNEEYAARRSLSTAFFVLPAKLFITEHISAAVLEEEYQGLLTYYIPLVNIKWSKLFNLIESNREQLYIEDYTISQTTLEEIFLNFAKDKSKEGIGSNKLSV